MSSVLTRASFSKQLLKLLTRLFLVRNGMFGGFQKFFNHYSPPSLV